MRKIKRIVIVIAIVLLNVNCKPKLKKTPLQERKKDELNLKENMNKLNFNCSTFLGKWSFLNNNENQDFHLELKKSNAGIVGEHCFIKGQKGENIDCSIEEKSIYLNCNQSIATGELESAYADDLIKIELKDTIKVKTLSDIGISFFYTDMIFVRDK